MISPVPVAAAKVAFVGPLSVTWTVSLASCTVSPRTATVIVFSVWLAMNVNVPVANAV